MFNLINNTISKFRSNIIFIFVLPVFILASAVFIYPIFKGLILLPLDLLISKYAPWYSPATILLKNPYMQDSVLQMYPWRHLVFQSLTKLIIPFWNPYQFLGAPFMASLKPMVFYPLNIFFVFGEVYAWHLLLFMQIFLSMFFSYLCARELKIRLLPSIIVSFAYAFNTYTVCLLEFGQDGQSLVWWPLLIFSIKRFIDSKNTIYLVILSCAVSIMIFTGHLQYITYSFIISALFILYYSFITKNNFKIIFFLLLSLFFGIGLGSFQLFPAWELFIQSHRSILPPEQLRDLFMNGLMPAYQLFRLTSPDFFGNPVTRDEAIGYIETSGYYGIIPLFFTIYTFINKNKNKIMKFFQFVFVISLLFSIQYIGNILYFLKIPAITNGSANRLFFSAIFTGTILAGYGVDCFVSQKKYRNNWIYLLIFYAFLILVFVFGALFNGNFSELNTNFIKNVRFPFLIFSLFLIITIIYMYFSNKKASNYIRTFYVLLIIFLVYADLFRLGYRFLTFSNPKFLYPETNLIKYVKNNLSNPLNRVYGITEAELGTYLNINTIETYNPLYLDRTARFLHSLQGLSSQLEDNNKYSLNYKNPKLKDLLDFLGVEFLVFARDENPSTIISGSGKYAADYDKVYGDDKYDVYINKSMHQRFKLFYNYRYENSDASILSNLNDQSFDKKNILLLDKILPVTLTSGSGSANLISNNVNSQTFTVLTNKPALFYVSDTHYPGWKAWINGKPTEILRANYNFRAVLIPSGTSIVKFEYIPTYFKFGLFISGLCLVLSITLLILKNRIYDYLVKT